jgi:hypothetical protein
LLCNSEAFAIAALGLEFLIVCTNPALGRDFFIITTLLITAALVTEKFGILPESIETLMQMKFIPAVYLGVGILTLVLSTILVMKTRTAFTEWQSVFVCIFLMAFGLLPFLYLPIASMTSPPVNQGYPRTADGYLHVVSRGQFERLMPTDNFESFWRQMRLYIESVTIHFGIFYLLVGLIPFYFLPRMECRERRWMLGLLGLFLCLSIFWVIMLNPALDSQTAYMLAPFFSPSHLVIALWSGYGLAIIGNAINRKRAQ